MYKVVNVPGLLQPTAFKVVANGNFWIALLVDADRVEWAVNLDISMPAVFRLILVHFVVVCPSRHLSEGFPAYKKFCL